MFSERFLLHLLCPSSLCWHQFLKSWLLVCPAWIKLTGMGTLGIRGANCYARRSTPISPRCPRIPALDHPPRRLLEGPRDGSPVSVCGGSRPDPL